MILLLLSERGAAMNRQELGVSEERPQDAASETTPRHIERLMLRPCPSQEWARVLVAIVLLFQFFAWAAVRYEVSLRGCLPGILALAPILWWVLGRQIWQFSPPGLTVRFTILGLPWRQLHYTPGAWRIVPNNQGGWILLQQQGKRARLLYRCDSLSEILGLSSLLESKLGWPEVEWSEPPAYLRQQIEYAVFTSDSKEICAALDRPKVIPLLIEIRHGSDELMRSRTLSIFQAVENETGRLSALAESDDLAVQALAVGILGECSSPTSLPVLRRAVDSPALPVRTQAVVALGRRRDAESADALCRIIHSTPELQQVAAWALGELGDTRAVPTLVKLLSSSLGEADVAARRAAAVALGRMPGPKVVVALSAAVHDEEPAVRESSVEALGVLRDRDGAPALIEALADREPRIAMKAIVGLGRIGDPKALPDLCQLLEHGGIELRVRAAGALGDIGGEPAVDALCRALKDSDARVRLQAVSALGKLAAGEGVPIQIRAAIPTLRSQCGAFSQEGPDIRTAAKAALQQIEACTATAKHLPLPAKTDTATTENLPLPVSPSD